MALRPPKSSVAIGREELHKPTFESREPREAGRRGPSFTLPQNKDRSSSRGPQALRQRASFWNQGQGSPSPGRSHRGTILRNSRWSHAGTGRSSTSVFRNHQPTHTRNSLSQEPFRTSIQGQSDEAIGVDEEQEEKDGDDFFVEDDSRETVSLSRVKREDSVYNLIRMREHLKHERDKAPQEAFATRWAEYCLEPIHPENRYRMSWDCMLLILIFFLGITVPIDLGLVELTGLEWEVLEICLIAFFAIDILLNFNSAYYDSYGQLVTGRCLIAKRYVQTWFLLDFCSTFPFDMILTASTFKGTSMMRLPRVVKMVRLARLMRLARVQSLLQKIFGLHLVTNMVVIFTVRFMSLFAALLLVTHWLACMFCALAHWAEDASLAEELYGDSPPAVMVGWEFDGVNALNMPPSRRYYAAFYFAFCSLQLLKPNDIIFRTSFCRYFFMLLGFIKPVVGASIMGVLTQMIVSQNNKRGTLQLKMQAIGIFMQKKRVPVRIQHQVLAYLEHAEKQMETLQDVDAIKTLSPTLRDEVAYNTNHLSICKFALFEHAFGISLVRHLCSLLKLELYGPDDVICQEGHFITSMAFVNTGCLKLFQLGGTQSIIEDDRGNIRNAARVSSSLPFMHFGPQIQLCGEVIAGQTFGAQALLHDTEYRITKTALCFVFCELSTLKREDFLKSVERSPEWKETLDKIRYALNAAEDPEGLLEKFAEGETNTLQALFEVRVEEPKASKPANLWKKAVNDIMKIKRESLGNLQMSDRREMGESTGCLGSGGMGSGFASMNLTPMERQMIMELTSVRRGVRDLVETTEDRLVQRVDEAEDRLEAQLFDMEQMLWTLLPEGQDEPCREEGFRGAEPPRRVVGIPDAEAEADAAAGGTPDRAGVASNWVVVESSDAASNASSGSWTATV